MQSEPARLSPRQLEALQLYADDMKMSVIAREMNVTRGQVVNLFQQVHQRLGVSSSAAAVAQGFRLGLLH